MSDPLVGLGLMLILAGLAGLLAVLLVRRLRPPADEEGDLEDAAGHADSEEADT